MEDWRQCVATAEQGLEGEPSPYLGGKLYAVAGSCESAAGNARKASRFFDRGLEIYPDDAILRFNAAVRLLADGKADKAARHFERAIEVQPTFTSPYLALGGVEHARGHRVQALLLWLRFAQLESSTERTRDASVLIYGVFAGAVDPQADGTFKLSVPASDKKNPYGTLELALGLAGAAATMPPAEGEPAHSPTARQTSSLARFLSLLAEQGPPAGEEETVVWKLAGRRLAALTAADRETFAWLLAERAGLPDAAAWVQENSDRVGAYRQSVR
jgi:hypothetical protein